MPVPAPRRLRARRTAALVAGLLATATSAPVAAQADAGSIDRGALTWSSVAIYDSSAPANTNRTWLGYTTAPPPLASGTVTPSAGATGDTVTVASTRGATYAWTYPATGGTFDPATRTGILQFKGTVTFASTLHGFSISVEDPMVVLNGAMGTLAASGTGSLSMNPGESSRYDRSKPEFTLDLSRATTTTGADGTMTIAGIAPAIAMSPWAFPSTYAVGAGPERTPNTFGSFAVSVRNGTGPVAAPDPAPAPAPAPAAPKGPVPATVRAGKAPDRVTVTLARSPGTAGSTYVVRLTRAGAVVAEGRLRGRAATLTLHRTKKGLPKIHGAYKLKPATGDDPTLPATSITIA